MSSPASAQIPFAVLEQLRGAADAMGIDLPGMAKFAPTVDVTTPIRALAFELGRLLAGRDLFLKAGEVGTVNAETGEWKRMAARRFPGWCEEFCAFKAPGARRLRDSLAVEDAAQILEMDIFLEQLRPLESIHTMRLPVRRGGEGWSVEWLPEGYDAETRIYTVDRLKYPLDWSLEEAREFLDGHGEEYPWTWSTEEHGPVGTNRSWSAVVATMVGVYCRAFFPPGTPRPMMAVLGNQPGTGKSTIVAMCLMAVYGHASAGKTPKDETEMDKELETAARVFAPYLFLDDIGGGLFSSPLNRFITASSHAGRAMGGNSEMFRVPNVTQVFATGNDIKISADLMRRSLVAELHLATEVRGRKYRRTITPMYLSKEETRKGFLAALAALVRHTVETIAEMKAEGVDYAEPGGMESFEDYTKTISMIAQRAGYTDPLAAPELTAGGAEDEDEMRELLIRLASETALDVEFDRLEMVEAARRMGLLEGLVGGPGDKELDSSAMKRWGRQLQRWRGRELVDENGRRFRFSHRKQRRGAKYPLTFIAAKA
jgi:hypothetical protein